MRMSLMSKQKGQSPSDPAVASTLLTQQFQPIPAHHARGSYLWGENLTLMSSYQACKRKQEAAKATSIDSSEAS
ncbi:hypothetical protein NC651_007574 [Populus alba x Populus x berolinensis]|nr:hypothetical protein NC651_007574 [Populus alba x Populus x berolinensis]